MDPVRSPLLMFDPSKPFYLLASSSPGISELQRFLTGRGAKVQLEATASGLIASLQNSIAPSLVLLDPDLPGMDLDELLAKVHVTGPARELPVVLIADSLTQDWLDRVSAGVIQDVIPRSATSLTWRLRLDVLTRGLALASEAHQLREATLAGSSIDPVTGIYNHTAMLSMLFRETDRVQRLRGSLCMILFQIIELPRRRAELGSTTTNDLLVEVVKRVQRLLRSYDLFGRVANDKFLAGLPGCTAANALVLAGRIQKEIFGSPLQAGGNPVRLSACFGVVASQGRSPVVVMREAEQALVRARAAGPDSIHCCSDTGWEEPASAALLSSSSIEDLLAW